MESALGLATALRCLRPDDRGDLVDVGANIGTTCIAMLRSRRFSRALAVEPEPENYRFLVRNVARNGLAASIRTLNCALSATSGRIDMEISRGNSADHRVRIGAPPDGADYYHESRRAVVSVPVSTLDDLAKDGHLVPERVRMIWMDVQGHELHVLRGATSVLRPGVPVIVEFWPYGLHRAGVAPAAFCAEVGAMFDRYFDLAENPPKARPTVELPRLFERYSGPKGSTDLLLLRDRDQPRVRNA